MIAQGVLITADQNSSFFGGDGDEFLSLQEARAVLLSAGYTASARPGFNPRFVVQESKY